MHHGTLDERVDVGLCFHPAYASCGEKNHCAQSAFEGPVANLEVAAHCCSPPSNLNPDSLDPGVDSRAWQTSLIVSTSFLFNRLAWVRQATRHAHHHPKALHSNRTSRVADKLDACRSISSTSLNLPHPHT